MAQHGARLVLGARRLDRLRVLAGELSLAHDDVIETDVTDFAQVKRLVNHAVEAHGRIDVPINNAGTMPFAPLERCKVDDWNRVIDVNIKGVLHGIGAALPHIKAPMSGHFIDVASVAGHKVGPDHVVCSATKAAVRVISEGLRQEVKPYDIRTTIISPGAVATERPDSITEPDIRGMVRARYAKAAISADSFARTVLFVMSQPDDMDVNEILYRPTAPGRALIGKSLPRVMQFCADGHLTLCSARPEEKWSVTWEHA